MKTYIFLLPTFWGLKNLSRGTFKCLLYVGKLFKTCYSSVDLDPYS